MRLLQMLFLTSMIGCFPFGILAQPACLELKWEKTYGGSEDDWAKAIRKVGSDGFVVAGSSRSPDGVVNTNRGDWDFWVIRINEDGDLLWERSYGGSGIDQANDIQPTSDGGFIVVGGSQSDDGDVGGNYGNDDFWIVKINVVGTIEWEQHFGGLQAEVAESVVQTPDGGYLVAGYTESSNLDVGNSLGSFDYWVIKITAAGNLEWERNYGGSRAEFAFSVVASNDGNYLVGGSSFSQNGDISLNRGFYDYWLLKINPQGNILWEKSFGGSQEDRSYEIFTLNNGDIILAGSTNSNDGDINNNHGNRDFLVLRLNSNGDIIWSNNYGGTATETAFAVTQIDEGIVISGSSASSNDQVPGNKGQDDLWTILLNDNGEIRWSANYGGTKPEQAESAWPTGEGGFMLAGFTQSNNGDVALHQGNRDFWVLRIDPKEITPDLGADTLLCPNATLHLQSDIVAPFYLWQDGSSAADLLVNAPGTYWLRVQDAGCVGFDTILIDYLPEDIFYPNTDTTLCLGDTLLLQAWPGGAQYQWQDGSSALSYQITQPGLYELSIGTPFCTISNSINVDFSDFTPRLGSDVTLCGDDFLTLRPQVPAGSKLLWQDGSTGATYEISQPGIFWVEVETGGCVRSDSIEISYLEDPGNLLEDRTTICENENITLDVFRENALYFWEDGSTESSRNISEPGRYVVELDFFNCSFKDTIRIDACETCLLLPNAFTPNGDGTNDDFRPAVRCELFDYQLHIINRYGQRVFSTGAPDEGWDGKFQGRQAQVGVYYCQVFYKIRNNGKLIPQEARGPVVVVR